MARKTKSSPSGPSIRIVHISDLHLREERLADFRTRCKALMSDIEELFLPVDRLVLSGDIAYSGRKSEYQLVAKEFLAPVRARLHLASSQILVVPGNHDVDRSRVDAMREKGLKAQLEESPGLADEFFRKPEYSYGHMSCFFEAMAEYCPWNGQGYGTGTVTQLGLSVGIALLNSAWRCGDDDTYRKLFLSRYQVLKALETLQGSHLRIVVLHHPMDWLHLAEGRGQTVCDLRREFQIVLTGHRHENESSAVTTPADDCVFLTAPAFFDGHDCETADGYNIYDIALADNRMRCHYRKFVPKRGMFDLNVDHAQNGEKTFDIPQRSLLVRSGSGYLPQRVAVVCTELQSRIQKQLSLTQDRDDPIFVPPRVLKVTWKRGVERKSPLPDWVKEISANPCVIYGPPEVGKTLLLESVAAESASGDGAICLYIDMKEVGWEPGGRKALRDVLETRFGAAQVGGTLEGTTFLLDHLPLDEPTLEQLSSLRDGSGIRIAFTVGNDLLFNALCNDERFAGFLKLEVPYWGPSRIREFAERFFTNEGVDVHAACSFIEASLKSCDLPLTPTIVAMYLAVFPRLGNKLTGLSFIRLLEQVEQQRLDRSRAEKSSSYGFYNRRRALVWLAHEMCKTRQLHLSYAASCGWVRDSFTRANLEVDEQRFVDELVDTGILRRNGDLLEFGCFVLFDYYLALAMQSGVVSVKDYLASIDSAVPIGHALGIYAGMSRENEELLDDLFWLVHEEFGDHEVADLAGLDAHITALLDSPHRSDEADKIVRRDIEATVDTEEREAEFERSRSAGKATRQALAENGSGKLNVQRVGRLILALKVFYNAFRNMENIDGKRKEDFLNNVLGLHILCNMELIDYFHAVIDDDDFRSLTAYVFTIGGQAFLCEEMGTQSLKVTIENCMASCTNDFKRFLLLCLYADFRFDGYTTRLKEFLRLTESHAAVEMIYLKTRRLVIEHDAKTVPASLIGLFTDAFEARQRFQGKMSSIDFGRMKSMALEELRRERHVHTQQKQAT
jgi:predicted MPP superfamily phosphohydrolase